MARDVSDASPIESRDELVAWIAEGEKPKAQWRIGTEHEKIPFYRAGRSPVPYAGDRGIAALLEGLQRESGWEPIRDGDNIIGLFEGEGGGAISLEPGGQFELSGALTSDIHETMDELDAHIDAAKRVAGPLDIGFLDLGMSPVWSREETPIMPKSRYRIMMGYMPKVGTLGLDMMLRTATVQVNLDYSSEADMVRKLRASLALQPISTALFANSPFTDGKPNGFQSMRSQIWTDTDPHRTGMMPAAFEDGFGYERYVDWVLDVPMYFVMRDGRYHDVAGESFRDLLEGRLPQLPGVTASRSDWANHVSTVFPEVRLKRFLEMRGADAGPRSHLAAMPAYWVGLLYDQSALDAAYDLVKKWSAEERQALRDAVPREGLSARIGGHSVQDLARETLRIARAGLSARKISDRLGRDETRFLDPLEQIVESGTNRAQQLLALYHGRWNGSLDPAFEECAF